MLVNTTTNCSHTAHQSRLNFDNYVLLLGGTTTRVFDNTYCPSFANRTEQPGSCTHL